MNKRNFAKFPLHRFNPLSQLLSQLSFEIHMFSRHVGTAESWKKFDYIVPSNVIYFITGGDGQIINNGQSIPLLPGHAYLMPVNALMSHFCKTCIEKYWIIFSMEVFPAMDIMNNLGECYHLGKFDLGSHSSMMERIKRKGIADYFFLEGVTLQMLSCLDIAWEDIFNRRIYQDRIYREIFKYIQDNLNSVIRIDELADHLETAPDQLSRMFKKDMGQTLKSFINQKKYQRACALLTGTKLKSKDIAGEIGFEDEYYFIRFFKKHCGVSPTQYRSSIVSL